jgi:hypothetical protein
MNGPFIVLGPLGLGGPELIILLIIAVAIILIVSRLRRKKPNVPNIPHVYINNQSNASVQSNASPSASDKLTQLKKLKDDGIISEEDYQKKKEEIMRSF